jgi:hypothetical protein
MRRCRMTPGFRMLTGQSLNSYFGWQRNNFDRLAISVTDFFSPILCAKYFCASRASAAFGDTSSTRSYHVDPMLMS